MVLPTSEDVLKLALALVIGGLIGAEREFRDKAAGFRTMTLICVGACLFTSASLGMGGPSMRDPARIAAQIVTGVGFLGAGVIVREGGRVTGVTTAATIWLTAALGMGIGGGFYGMTLLATGTVLLTLWLLPYVEHIIDREREVRSYRLVCEPGIKHDEVEALLVANGLELREPRRTKEQGTVVLSWRAQGPPAAHDRACDALMSAAAVRAYSF